MEDFARALQAMTAGGLLPGGGMQPRGRPTTPLNFVLPADSVLPILRSDASGAMAAALLPHLPEGQRTEEHLYAILRSPQLAQAMQSLTAAVDSEQSGAVLSNLGLRPQDADAALASGDSVAALIEAIQADSNRRRQESASAATGTSGGAGSGSGSGSGSGEDGSGSGGDSGSSSGQK